MRGRKQILRIIAVLSVAMATGHTVEYLRPAPVAGGAPSSATVAMAGGISAPLPDLAGITPVAAAGDRTGGDGCTRSLDLTAAPGAMIELQLSAPCDAGERVVLRHSGLSFTAQVGADGRLALALPALEEEALVAAYFDGSEVALQSVAVPEAARQLRFVFQAPFPLQFDLRAEEAGQVFVGSARQAGDVGARRILRLGSNGVSQPMLAQVYTFPRSNPAAADLTVELRITADTCSHSFMAETLLAVDGSVRRQTLPVSLPLCGTSGDILVLKNLVRAPTLAHPE
jgi:hypothetical protein